MELTKLTHTLTIGGISHVIDEPIGFDGLKTKISRGTYHGVSAEVSVSKLEFYNNGGRNAATLIRDAYNTDIDTEIAYTVTDETGEQLYSGVLDLSTYSETIGNATKISVNVGEVGIKTTFNNRSETEIDLNRNDTMDGNALAHNQEWKKMRIPRKTILYRNESRARTQVQYTEENTQSGRFRLAVDKSHQWINIVPSETPQLYEFGSFGGMVDIADSIRASDQYIGDAYIDEYYQPFFEKGSGWAEKYGDTAKYSLDIKMNVKIEALETLFSEHVTVNEGRYEYDCYLALIGIGTKFNRYITNEKYPEKNFTPIWKSGLYHMNDNEGGHSITIPVNLQMQNLEYTKLYFGLFMLNDNYNHALKNYYWCSAGKDDEDVLYGTAMRVTIDEGGYIKMECESSGINKDVDADMIMTHEALNKIVECISDNQLHVESLLYARPDSVYPSASIGKGALKALTNGYKIRGLFTDDDNQRNMPMSFKNIIESLDAIDCIGWGFVNENGALVIRVESWEWFYKDDVVLTIDNPNEKTRTATQDNLITQLTIGYKKYTTNEDINSIDSIHSERVFTSGVKAVTKEVSKLCQFIADNYSVESTRRKAIENTSDEYKYDENIFVFELKRYQTREVHGELIHIGYAYEIATNCISQSEGISVPAELFNAALSPRRMAERWKKRMMFANSQKNFDLTKGTVNYKAAFKTPSKSPYSMVDYLDTVTTKLAEDAPIENGAPLMKCETLKIKYPLSLAQYKAILANPYGLIVVDGEKCWLKEMQYEFKTGNTELTLIPKYEQ